MSWFRRSEKGGKAASARKRWSPKRRKAARRASIKKGLGAMAAVAVLVGLVWGARRLEAHVLAQPRYQRIAEIVLAGAPDGVEERLTPLIESVNVGPWTDPTLCRRLAEALDASAWVRRVESVRRYADGVVVATCDYRSPGMLFQYGGEFFLSSDDGVRMPGRYSYHPSLVVVQGVAGQPPEPGKAWTGRDASAAMALFDHLRGEPFFNQVTGILVENYGGRDNKRESHILLACGSEGSRIAWGSAPGEEIEENSVEQKIELLRENYRRWGRIDAGRRYIDISTFADRFTTREPG